MSADRIYPSDMYRRLADGVYVAVVASFCLSTTLMSPMT